jgi:hypothetical protein
MVSSGAPDSSNGLQRDRSAAGHVEKADDMAVLHDRLPAEQGLHALQQCADTPLPLIGHGSMVGFAERYFFVLGADAETGFRLGPLGEPRDQFIARFDGGHVDLIARHGPLRLAGRET